MKQPSPVGSIQSYRFRASSPGSEPMFIEDMRVDPLILGRFEIF